MAKTKSSIKKTTLKKKPEVLSKITRKQWTAPLGDTDGSISSGQDDDNDAPSSSDNEVDESVGEVESDEESATDTNENDTDNKVSLMDPDYDQDETYFPRGSHVLDCFRDAFEDLCHYHKCTPSVLLRRFTDPILSAGQQYRHAMLSSSTSSTINGSLSLVPQRLSTSRASGSPLIAMDGLLADCPSFT